MPFIYQYQAQCSLGFFLNLFVENVMHRVLGNRDNLMIRLTLEFKDTGPCLSLTKKISLVPVQGNREAVCHLVLEFIKELPQLLFPYIIPSSRIKPHTIQQCADHHLS